MMVIVIKNGGTKRCEIKGIVKFNYCKSWSFKNEVVMMIKDWKLLVELQQIHMRNKQWESM